MTMTVIAAGAMVGPGGVDHHVRLGWLAPRFGMDNPWGEGTVSASSEANNHDAARAQNDSTWDSWRPTGTTEEWIQCLFDQAELINYVALAEIDLHGNSLEVQYKSGDDWVSLDAPGGGLDADFSTDTYILTKNHPDFAGAVIFEFSQIETDGIRILVKDGTEAAQIGHVRAGFALVPNIGMQRGWQPPTLNVDARFSTPLNEAGALLGRHVRSRTARTDVRLTPLDYEWTSDKWRKFISDGLDTPLFMWWSFRGRAEAVYGVIRDPQGSLQNAGEAQVGFQLEIVAQ